MHKAQASDGVRRKGWSEWAALVAWRGKQAEDTARSRRLLRKVVRSRRESHSQSSKSTGTRAEEHFLAFLIQITGNLFLEEIQV